jgi:carbonic anhydrase
MDFRLGPALDRFLEAQDLGGDCDVVSLAGAAKGFTDDESRDLLMKQIDISKRLHGIEEVYLMSHTDCGAYGGKKAFADDAAEHARLVSDMRQAAELIVGKWPELQVRLWIPHIDEVGHETKVWIEKID